MTGYERFTLIIRAATLGALLSIMIDLALYLPVLAHASPRSCTFDGGSTLVSGDAARKHGQIWACADGQLYRLPGHFPAGRNNH